ncbi:MAG: hypothetical protein K1X44_05965 [Alphaproteobacteria bacterium]|nr:hypothetical protein [Alphaproteobacteria bacterium]
MTNIIVEWAPFVLKTNIDEQKFLIASDIMQQQFLSKQKGFIRRDLLKEEQGYYADLVYWQSKNDAEEAVKAFKQNISCLNYLEFMDKTGHINLQICIAHFVLIKSY